MRKSIRKLRDLVADLRSISAKALAESDRLVKRLDREATRTRASKTSKNKKTSGKKGARKAR